MELFLHSFAYLISGSFSHMNERDVLNWGKTLLFSCVVEWEKVSCVNLPLLDICWTSLEGWNVVQGKPQ